MAVALRTITRIQDGDDAPTLGAGQDGYALTWDNASGAFVSTALFTGGLLATGATTGATSEAQVFTNGVVSGAAGNASSRLTLKNVDDTMDLKLYATHDTLNGEIDNLWALVYNWGSGTTVQDPAHPRWGLAFEHNYRTGAGATWDEFYLMHDDLTTVPNVSIRPFMTVVDRATNTAVHALNGSWTNFSLSDGTDTLLAVKPLNGLVQVYPGKALYIEETAVLGIGVSPTTSGSPLQIKRAADGQMATFLRDTVLAQIYSVAGNSTTGYSAVGTFSNHPFHIYANGSKVATAGVDGWFDVDIGIIARSYGIRYLHGGVGGVTAQVMSFEENTLPTYGSQIVASAATGWAGNQNIVQFDICAGGANTRRTALKLDGTARAYVATPASAPTDADLFAGSVSFYLDESAHKLHVRVKYANGTTLKVGEVALA